MTLVSAAWPWIVNPNQPRQPASRSQETTILAGPGFKSNQCIAGQTVAKTIRMESGKWVPVMCLTAIVTERGCVADQPQQRDVQRMLSIVL